MKRIAAIDGMLVATFVALLISVASCFGGAMEKKAYASNWSACPAPASCPANVAGCFGCMKGGQSGLCSSVSYPWFCSGNPAFCAGTDALGFACSCIQNAC